jgi:hypothetical protein
MLYLIEILKDKLNLIIKIFKNLILKLSFILYKIILNYQPITKTNEIIK